MLSRDDLDLARIGGVAAGPLLHELGDGPVEELVATDPGLQHVIADIAYGDPSPDSVRRRRVGPGTPGHQ